jgi:hypothetical protein
MNLIKSTCQAKLSIPIEELTVLQGNLAEMSKPAYKKLRELLIKYGIRFASHVWQSGKKNYIIDGTGRFKALLMMKEDGFDIEPIPCVTVEAKDLKEARRLILHGRDRFHETTDEGLYEFLSEAKLDFGDIKEEIEMPEIDLGKFGAEFFNEHATESAAASSDTVEIVIRIEKGKIKRDMKADLCGLIEKYGGKLKLPK